MKREIALNYLRENLSRKGSRAYKTFLDNNASRVISHYFNNGNLYEARSQYGEKNKGFVDEIYKQLYWIRKRASEKIAGSLGRDPVDTYKDNFKFVDGIVMYCSRNKNLKEHLEDVLELKLDDLTDLEKRKDPSLRIREKLEALGKHPIVYYFCKEKIL